MKKKQLTIDISQNILKKAKSRKINKASLLKKGLKIRDKFKMRKRTNISIDGETKNEIENIKENTGQPQWRVVEIALEEAIKEIGIKGGNDIHIEPEQCPECGSDELLISHNEYTWYCYDCEEKGEY